MKKFLASRPGPARIYQFMSNGIDDYYQLDKSISDISLLGVFLGYLSKSFKRAIVIGLRLACVIYKLFS